jgi:tetratricopeptide (TPR) repeat protein
MIRKLVMAGAILLTLVGLTSVSPAWAEEQDRPSYTPAEYNAYTACANDKAAPTRAKCLEDFMAKFPQSSLLPYAYQLAYTTYSELKNFPKSIEYADKLLALGEKIDLGTRIQASYIRAFNFHQVFSAQAADADDQARRAREAALLGVELIAKLPKPDNLTPEQFEQQKAAPLALFHYTAGFAALHLKQYAAAVESFRNALANNPNDAVTYFRMGVAYLQMDPPQYMDGFWSLARSVALKGPGEAQVRSYLRNQVVRYQGGTVCDKETDAELSELLTLAGSSAERPANYKIPSQAEIDQARQSVDKMIDILKAGGDQAKVMWLAVCGLQFPEVGGKVIEVANADDSVLLKLYLGSTPDETEAGEVANMEVKVVGQPAARLLKKDDAVLFAGMLNEYRPDPFLLRWDNAKVRADLLPEDKPEPAKKQPTKRPAKRPPAKGTGR